MTGSERSSSLDREGRVHPRRVVGHDVADKDVLSRCQVDCLRLGLAACELFDFVDDLDGTLVDLALLDGELVRRQVALDDDQFMGRRAFVLRLEVDRARRRPSLVELDGELFQHRDDLGPARGTA